MAIQLNSTTRNRSSVEADRHSVTAEWRCKDLSSIAHLSHIGKC
jgi:hypothetical protein